MSTPAGADLTVPVLVDGWQMECCGEPPGVGDRVSWRLTWTPEHADLLPTSLDLTADVTGWTPDESDPVLLSTDDAQQEPALATHGRLSVFVRLGAPLPATVRLRGVLHEDHHVDTPANLLPTSGTVGAVHLVSFEHELDPSRGERSWTQVPGTAQLTPVSRSPRWLPWEEPETGRTTRWRPGPTYVLVDLQVEDPAAES